MNVFKSKLIAFKTTALSSCLTICQLVLALVLSASTLAACGKAGMSGGGQTRDPGDGSGGSTGDGGGGQGIDCRASNNSSVQKKLFVRDIYEAQINRHFKMKSIADNSENKNKISEEAARALTKSLRDYYGPASYNLQFVREKFWIEFADKISFINDEKKLYPSQDANSPITLVEGCKIVQIAYWDESSDPSGNGTLYVDQKLWSELDQLNKVGLLAHEFFYKQARKAQSKNSDSTRGHVGELLSENGMKPLFSKWESAADPELMGFLPKSKEKYNFCVGTASDDKEAKLLLYKYLGDDKSENFIIPYLVSSSINLNYFQSTSFAIPYSNVPWYSRTIIHDFTAFPTEMIAYLNTNQKVKSLSWVADWYDDELQIIGVHDQYIFNKIIEEISLSPEVLWTTRIKSNDPINIAYLNPVPKNQAKRTLKSGAELKRLTLQKMSEQLDICAGEGLTLKSHQAIFNLSKKISEGTVNFQNEFINDSDWMSFLNSVNFTPPEIVPRGFKCDEHLKANLQVNYPSLLYKLEAQTYNSDDARRLLGASAYDGAPLKSSDSQIVRVSQGNSMLDFHLQCHSYNAMHTEIKRHKIGSEKEVTDKKITIRIKPPEPSIFPGTTIPKLRLLGRPEKKSPHKPEELLTIFSKISYTDEEAIFYDTFTNKLKLTDEELSIYKKIISSNNKLFFKDAKGESSIELSDCRAQSSEYSCVIVKMITHNRSYKVLFTVEGDESEIKFDSIFFAKLLINEESKKLPGN